MGQVNVDYSDLYHTQQNVMRAIETTEKTIAFITNRYQQMGTEWNDRKYKDLGDIVLECCKSLRTLDDILHTGKDYLQSIMAALKEYEEVSLGGGSSGTGETHQVLMTRDEVNARYQSGLADIDAIIDNYREALMERGVPEGHWLTKTLAMHRAAMIEQLGYNLDAASGHAQDSVNNSEAYPDIGDYSQFYDQLANEFRAFCLSENNPNYSDEEENEWSINCQRCVPTYEMQRRGMDVTAQPCFGHDALSGAPFSVWQSPQIISCNGVGNDEIETAMQEWGDGARAQVVVLWTPHEGHTFIAERINGQTHYIDPQSGNDNYTNWMDSAIPGCTQFCRIDNLEATERINNCYTEVQR